MGTELEYCMRRARQEAHRALACNEPEAAAAHQKLSIRYSARAFMLRADHEIDTTPVSIRSRA